MRRVWRKVRASMRTPLGRFQLARALFHASWPLLWRVACLHRRTLARRTRVVVVVGSFGKSTTTRAVLVALGGRDHPSATRNARSFVARSILKIRPGARWAVLEVGIDRPGAMGEYARVVRPDVAVVTSIGSEHLSSLGTLEVTRSEKAAMVRILPASGLAVLNGDDPNVLWMRSQTRTRVITFGFEAANDVRASDVALDWPHGTRFTLHANGETHPVRIRLTGKHMVYPALAALTVALAEGVPLAQALAALAALSPTPGRMEPVPLASGAWLLRDEYKSTLETIDAALDVLAEIPARRRVIVLGDVSEPPGSQGPIYKRLGERIAMIASEAIFVGGGYKRYSAGARAGLGRENLKDAGRSVLKAVALLGQDLGPGDVVFIKGRDTQKLDRVALALMGRTVRCEIDVCQVKLRCAECPMLERGWQTLG